MDQLNFEASWNGFYQNNDLFPLVEKLPSKGQPKKKLRNEEVDTRVILTMNLLLAACLWEVVKCRL